ncbi:MULTISPECIES: hypothetical protein [Streptomyces]|uniref:Uncharacterized protein n=1 Tax=Streptomyces venezuelae TaxID=54571 RepID=A0A5P2BCK5_STRVZ|nr:MULTISPECIES: hypothetical protein [Streptomyces]NDZ98648.1 hypothetical protein [Streptomyces sp. SID10116]MYY81058.1 hypothetical protein [Streptomyces sp. SID335]MYZ19335.1 hypothetical protein [Streptomyces sp. SID337]NDZ87829.1 hypothetical protein [Streptomyces sp. SID10115]NEB48332.1 hypothetical protein [Streptomyces sp. SID339]
MSAGGFCKLPNGSVVVALTLPDPSRGGGTVRMIVHAVNRARALTRLRNLGLRAVYLRGNAEPPTPDEVTAVLHHPDGLIWRTAPDDVRELWHPIRALRRQSRAASRPSGTGAPF